MLPWPRWKNTCTAITAARSQPATGIKQEPTAQVTLTIKVCCSLLQNCCAITERDERATSLCTCQPATLNDPLGRDSTECNGYKLNHREARLQDADLLCNIKRYGKCCVSSMLTLVALTRKISRKYAGNLAASIVWGNRSNLNAINARTRGDDNIAFHGTLNFRFRSVFCSELVL